MWLPSRRSRVSSVGENTARIPVPGDPAAERLATVELCLYVLDRARSSAVAAKIVDGLAAVGVVTTSQDGEPFDPARHEAGGTVETDDPALEGVVAATEIPGFSDRGCLLRAPVVLVYRVR